MFRKYVMHGVLVTLILTSVSLSLLIWSSSETGIAASHREAPILIYEGRSIDQLQLNQSFPGLTRNQLSTATRALRLKVTPDPELNPKFNLEVDPEFDNVKMRFTSRHLDRLNRNGSVELPALIKRENRRQGALAFIENFKVDPPKENLGTAGEISENVGFTISVSPRRKGDRERD